MKIFLAGNNIPERERRLLKLMKYRLFSYFSFKDKAFFDAFLLYKK